MAYTFWHSGILIGESDLEDTRDHPRQRAGIFRPTPHGLTVFPRLTGMLSAMHELRANLEANGLVPDDMKEGEIHEVLDNTPAGQKIMDIGRALSEVEVRAADGRRLAFTQIAFSDLFELQRLVRELQIDSESTVIELPPEAHRYIVSATFSERSPRSATAENGLANRVRQRPWPRVN
jgi:hypothetical protein